MPRIEVMGNRANESDGLGQLATEIEQYNHGVEGLEVVAVDLPQDADLVAYCRRTGETLDAAIAYCNKHHIPLVFLSSKITLPNIEWEMPVINASNTSPKVVGWMLQAVDLYNGPYKGWTPKIVEHHQESKQDISGTALATIRMMGLDPATVEIEQVRNFERSQAEFGIPDDNRGGYAAHVLTFTNPETDEISEPLKVVIWGRSDYARGLIALSRVAFNQPNLLPDGLHDIFQLARDKIFPAEAA